MNTTSKKKDYVFEQTKDKPNRILVADEKHAIRYFRAETQAELFASALMLVKERYDVGYYYNPTDKEIDTVKGYILSDEVLAKLPNGYHEDARKKSDYKKRELTDLLRAREDANAARTAIDTTDGLLAVKLLLHRKDYEYERIDFEYLESPESK